MWKKLPYRILLPLLNLALAIVLFAIGQAQWQRIASHSNFEGLPDIYKRARYVDYALNAPAWVAQMHMPWLLHVKSWGFMETERDWWYMLFVGLTWFSIGTWVDKKLHRTERGGPGISPRRVAWRRRVVAIISLFYGILMLNSVQEEFRPTRHYERWFFLSVLMWTAVITVAALLSLIKKAATSTEPM